MTPLTQCLFGEFGGLLSYGEPHPQASLGSGCLGTILAKCSWGLEPWQVEGLGWDPWAGLVWELL